MIRSCEVMTSLLDNFRSVDELLKYLEAELPKDFNQSIAKKFKDNNIDGFAFQEMTNNDLLKMKILNLGTRLRLMAKVKKISRGLEYKQRKAVIMKGECHVFPPGLEGKFELANSFLRFTYEKEFNEHPIVTHKGYCCWTTKTMVRKSVNAKFLDHVDLSKISDVDLSQTEIETTISTPNFLPCIKDHLEETKPKIINEVIISLNLKSEQGMPIAGPLDNKTVLRVYIKDIEEAKKFRQKLQDLIDEVQYMEANS